MEIGKQYKGDDKFKALARLHQSKYRMNVLKVDCDVYGNMLQESDGKKGLNFYNDFDILESVYERYGKKYNKQLYSNLLRSEHIPFNLFIPLRSDLDYAKNVMNELFAGNISEIETIKIEYAPKPKVNYLDDNTSFDAFIQYKHIDNTIGIIGIEVKYTEQAYSLKKDSIEEKKINDLESKYWKVAKKSNLFVDGVNEKIIQDDYRQIWRNQLLGESLKQGDKINHFTSTTLYPTGNKHFTKVMSEYDNFLKTKNKVKAITYESFIEALMKHSKNSKFDKWINYLKERYLVGSE